MALHVDDVTGTIEENALWVIIITVLQFLCVSVLGC